MFWFGKKERERNAPKVASFSSYDFNEEWFLVEMVFNVSSAEIDWCSIEVPDEKLDKENWQCAYLEQYLNEDGTEKICDLYDEPDPAVKPCRVAFFLFKDCPGTLQTPYGSFDLTKTEPLPDRLAGIMEFEEDD